MERRLTRDTRNAVLGGVAAGFARYFDVDPVLARIVFIALTALSGAGVVAYAVSWIVMPRDDRAGESAAQTPGAGASTVDRIVDQVRGAGERVAEEFQRLPRRGGRSRALAGTILIVLGGLFLLDRMAWLRWPQWARLANLWPLILIAAGASLILEGARGRRRKEP